MSGFDFDKKTVSSGTKLKETASSPQSKKARHYWSDKDPAGLLLLPVPSNKAWTNNNNFRILPLPKISGKAVQGTAQSGKTVDNPVKDFIERFEKDGPPSAAEKQAMLRLSRAVLKALEKKGATEGWFDEATRRHIADLTSDEAAGGFELPDPGRVSKTHGAKKTINYKAQEAKSEAKAGKAHSPAFRELGKELAEHNKERSSHTLSADEKKLIDKSLDKISKELEQNIARHFKEAEFRELGKALAIYNGRRSSNSPRAAAKNLLDKRIYESQEALSEVKPGAKHSSAFKELGKELAEHNKGRSVPEEKRPSILSNFLNFITGGRFASPAPEKKRSEASVKSKVPLGSKKSHGGDPGDR